MCVFQGEHSENLSEITENEEIFGLDDKIIGVVFFCNFSNEILHKWAKWNVRSFLFLKMVNP